MEIKSDLIRIQASDYDDRGQRLEPEEKPAERILGVDGLVSGQHGGILGNLRTSVSIQGTVDQFAQALKTKCAGCKHFDRVAFERWWNAADFSPSRERLHDREKITRILAEMAEEDDPGSEIVDERVAGDLAVLGICHVLSEITKEPLIVHPESCCPEEYCSESAPSGFFVAANKDVQRVTSAAFDQIMHQAMNK